jgi:hypothetical protein
MADLASGKVVSNSGLRFLVQKCLSLLGWNFAGIARVIPSFRGLYLERLLMKMVLKLNDKIPEE